MSLLIDERLVDVPGVTVLGPDQHALSPGDCTPRSSTAWVRQFFLHKTIADDPEKLLPGAGPTGGAEATAAFWAGDPEHSAAQLIVDFDGRVLCLADLQLVAAYHATVSNMWSVGLEMKEQVGGGVFQITLDNAVKVCVATCRAMGIQMQIPRLPYSGRPIRRMIGGGPDMVGVFGHRDNTDRRGRWDPGDAVFGLLIRMGVPQFDFDAGEDLVHWRPIQQDLKNRGLYDGDCDGVPGPKTTAALKADGYIDGIWALGKVLFDGDERTKQGDHL